jgi:ATP-dependent DNA helicase RecQ
VVDLPDDAHRLAWLTETLDELPGSGIIYCLTVDQADTAAAWLRSRGHHVAAYTGSVEPEQRLALESALRANELKALVATSALGMGFDKGDLAFCVHLGLPPTPVAYYQQVGRAGRAIDRAEVIALPRPTEDAAVWRWFESVSLPSEEICRSVLDLLDVDRPTSIAALEPNVNMGRSRLGILLSILEVDGAIDRSGSGYVRTDQHWSYDHELVASLRELRRAEADQMLAWADLDTCRLRFLREALDDATATDCGRCDRCTSDTWQRSPDPLVVAAAQDVLRGGDIEIEPRRQWPTGLGQPKGKIAVDRQHEPGRALARLGDGGWNPIVEQLIASAEGGGDADLPEPLVAAITAILKRWHWSARPTWICPVPSRRRSKLINGVATALGALGKLPVHEALVAASPAASGFQADQANSAHQVTNVWDRFLVDGDRLPEREVLAGPVLLVDDEVDSRWTMTVATWQLTGAGAGPVLPFSLRTR